jgi:hypothetical protein
MGCYWARYVRPDGFSLPFVVEVDEDGMFLSIGGTSPKRLDPNMQFILIDPPPQ